MDFLMTAPGLDFWKTLYMPYPTGKIIADERVQAVYWLYQLSNHVAVAIRYASVLMPLHAAVCPHACKLTADWLSVVCTCFTCEFKPS